MVRYQLVMEKIEPVAESENADLERVTRYVLNAEMDADLVAEAFEEMGLDGEPPDPEAN